MYRILFDPARIAFRMLTPFVFFAASVLSAGHIHARGGTGTTGVNMSVVDIATGPLLQGDGRIHQNVLLALSLDDSIAGIAHKEARYDRTKSYIGYFDHRQCYRYAGTVEDGYFSPVANADGLHECRHVPAGRFSGNFMNWASASALDILRYSLTGGDRIVDVPGKTVLQRATLPDSFFASAYFPLRRLVSGATGSSPSSVTPFDDDAIVAASCRNHIVFGASAAGLGRCDEAGNQGKRGRYLVRVQVCDAKEGPNRPHLCRRYGSDFKPVGEIQRHADQLRFGVFGYLLDDSLGRYGGVLREPMKSVGERRYGTGSASEPNPEREWDPATGVLSTNPAKADGGQSGVINYLNQLGRGGRYKRHDPVSELFYEGLRYYRNLGPTAAATHNMTPAMADGFPVVRPWQDPITASCQRNAIALIADAQTHCDKSIPGNRRGSGLCADDNVVPKDETDFAGWTDQVGKYEGRIDLSRASTGATDASYYLAGLAYWANTQDIRPDLPGRQTARTYSIDMSEAGEDGVARVRRRQLYYAGKYGGFEDANDDGNPFLTANPGDPENNSYPSDREWESEPGSGIPRGYFPAGDPNGMAQGVQRLFDALSHDGGTTGSFAVSAAAVHPRGTSVYRSGFHRRRWAGTLTSHAARFGEDGKLTIGALQWEAGRRMTDEQIRTDAHRLQRRIFTLRADGEAVPFAWETIGTEYRQVLDTDPATGVQDGRGKGRLEYLHGVRAREAHHPDGNFRSRDSVLGDVIHSAPVYVGEPTATISDPEYLPFLEATKRRLPIVYVGANDGMLHAFDARSGDEVFAYLPRAVFSDLPQLTDPGYRHRPFVDATPTIAEAQVRSVWKTVLVSGFGGGAQGIFALDVTNPESFGPSSVLWEFTDKDDPDIGNVMGEVQIAKFHVGAGRYRWFAVVSSGLNNNRQDGARNQKASGVLFLLALDKPAKSAWREKANYWKLSVPASRHDLPNGLGPAGLVLGNAREALTAYAGDLQGNLWKFDFASGEPFTTTGSINRPPLFRAHDEKKAPQPITVRPRIAHAPGGGYLVLFGTGKLFENGDVDPAGFSTQSFYAVHDREEQKGAGFDRTLLEPRTFVAGTGASLRVEGKPFVLGTGTTRKRGWYVDYRDARKTGERSITSAALQAGQAFFNTIMFDPDPCVGEAGRSYALDILTGMPALGDDPVGKASPVGAAAMPAIVSLQTETGKLGATGLRSVRKRYAIVHAGTRGIGSSAAVQRVDREGQLSWREIVDFQQLQRNKRNDQ